MKKMIVLMLSLVMIFMFLVSCTNSETVCQTHKDCTTATCCHASEAVNKEHGPNCAGKLCSMECQEGTIDCAQGRVDCVNNQCVIVLNEE